MVRSVTIRPNSVGAGHFVLIATDEHPEPFAVGGTIPTMPIFDFAQVMSTAALWTTRMLLGHEATSG